jgi:septum formation protein
MKTLILASQSPRRSEILKKEKFFFVPFPVYVSEIPDKNLSLNEQIIDIARRKAMACLDLYLAQSAEKNPEAVILSADTMVCIDNLALGKPDDDEEAMKTLKMLSGRIHQVKTAVFIIDLKNNKSVSHIETTDVYFKKLSDNDILNYLKTREHVDKAGSYGIQGQAKVFIEKFVGDYNNVVGLPIDAVKKIFLNQKWNMQRVE